MERVCDVARAVEDLDPHLDEVELVNVELVERGSYRHVADVVAVHGHDVGVAEVAGNSSLTGKPGHHPIAFIVLEDDSLDRHLQPPPLPCMHLTSDEGSDNGPDEISRSRSATMKGPPHCV
jgi:hypothetical protein